MRKMLVLTTLLFGLLLAGCSEDSNNGSQSGNGGSAGFEGNNPALSIVTQYAGGLRVNFHAELFGNVIGETYTYLWDFGDKYNSDQNAQTNVPNPSYLYSTEGTYTIKVSVTDSMGQSIGYTTAQVKVSTSGNILGGALNKSPDVNDMLTYKFMNPAYSDDGVPLEFTWDFGDGTTPTKGANNITHRFNQYGKTYTVVSTAENRAANKTDKQTNTVTIPTPEFDIECASSGLTVTCTPFVSGIQGSLDNAVYTWTFGAESSTGATVVTSNNEQAIYTYNGSGAKIISVTGTSSDVVGELQASKNVNLSNQVSLDPINCQSTGNLLEYTCDVNARLADNTTVTIAGYDWLFNQQPTSTDNNTATYTFGQFPSTVNPSYPVTVTVRLDGSSDTATQSTRINIAHPTVTISKGTASSNTAANFNASLSHEITGATYTWTITGPGGFNKTVSGVDKTSTGDVELQSNGTYTANLTVSHSSFAANISAAPFQITSSSAVEGAEISCSQVDGMKYQCTTNAIGYATVDGVREQVPLTYEWRIDRGDGNESYTNSNQTFTQQLQKYKGTYRVNLLLRPQGTNTAARAPEKTIYTNHATMSVTRSAATIAPNNNVSFSVEYGNLVNNIQPKDTDITWYIDGQAQAGQKNQTFTTSFTQAKRYTIKAQVNASNFGAPLTAQTTVEVVATTVKPEHIQGVTVECTTPNANTNDIRKRCTATIQITAAGSSAGVQANQLQAYLIPIGVRGNPDSQAVVFNNGETKDIIFDWPFLNIAEITDRNAEKKFSAYLRKHVYSNGKKVVELQNQHFEIKYPKVSYEIVHQANGATNKIGSGSAILLKSNVAPFNGKATWEWKMNFNGISGSRSKTFTMGVGTRVDFKDQMVGARFSGPVKGNPFNIENGFGVKIYSNDNNVLSKPLYLYGVNTQVGLKELTNALGNYQGGRAWMSPEGTIGFEGYIFRDMVQGTYLADFAIQVDAAYNTSGWAPYCTIGSIGYKNGARWLFTMPEAKVLRANKADRTKFFAEFGNRAGYIRENRVKNTAQGGVPAMPAKTGVDFSYRNKGEKFNLREFGLRGVHLGIMTQSGKLQTCFEVKRFDYTNSDNGAYWPEKGY